MINAGRSMTMLFLCDINQKLNKNLSLRRYIVYLHIFCFLLSTDTSVYFVTDTTQLLLDALYLKMNKSESDSFNTLN